MHLKRFIQQIFDLRGLSEFFGEAFWLGERENFPKISRGLYTAFLEIAITSALIGFFCGVLTVVFAVLL